MIVRHNPEQGLDQVDQAWFESDAADNNQAIREIDVEAARYGLVRTREYWLQILTLPDGRLVRRGFCYRPEPSIIGHRLAELRANDLPGRSSKDMVREMRDNE